MVSANLRYRNVVPWNYFAVECSSISFNGNENLVLLLNRIANLIEYEKYDEHNKLIEELSQMRNSTYEEWLEWNKEISNLKKKHVLWMLSKEHREEMSILKEECSKLATNYENAGLAISDLENSKTFSAIELTVKFKQLLSKLGFTCKSTSCNESNLHMEIYESTCSDEELFYRAKLMYSNLKEKNKKSDTINNHANEESYEDDDLCSVDEKNL